MTDPVDRLAAEYGLVGLDGLDVVTGPPPPGKERPLRFSPEAARTVRREIERAGGREVCFLAAVDEGREVVDARAVARGNRDATLAVARDAPQGGLLIHNHPSGVLEPSDADLAVAGKVWEEGLGTAITDNAASDLYVVVEPPEPRRRVEIDAEELGSLLAPGGPLSRRPEYEDRAGQREMLRLVADRYNEGGVGLVEAGTGTGKSLAYLLPAARWGELNAERTVVSTSTINLQEQLDGKDLPIVRDVLGRDVEWALVKGRGNYVSIRRARLAAQGAGSLFGDERETEIADLLEWTLSTDDGSLADLPFLPSDEAWEEVRSDPDICLRAKCPHFADCFYQRSRRRAASARLLVVNHHLLFADLAVRRATENYVQGAVLPPYRHVILDEAHNVEDAATAHFGVEVSRRGLFRAMSRLDRRGRGVLAALEEDLAGTSGEDVLEWIGARVRPELDHARDAVTELIDGLEAWCPSGESTVRLGGGDEPLDRTGVLESFTAASGTLGTLVRGLSELRRRVDLDESRESTVAVRLLDVQSVERRLNAARHALRIVLDPAERDGRWVRWLERKRGRGSNLVLAAAPIDVGETLRQALFAKMDSVTMTSATLATRNTFQFLRGRLGLSEDLEESEVELEVEGRIIPSPFDFERQTLLAVPTDLPEAGGGGSPALDGRTARVVADLAELTDGGIFALFTSHASLRAVAKHLREMGVDERWPLFVHGEDRRARLTARFRSSGRGVLIGTSSFWEGVDVPGHALRSLVIQKLPFRVPTDPITAARLEAIERSGGNAFHQLLLPLAALRLKQGFGRLIRSHDDRGTVVLLDDRIVRKRYGRYLRASLPPVPLVKGPWEELRPRLRMFHAG